MNAPVNVQVQVPVPFPALVTGTGPITIDKRNGIWTLGYSVAGLAVQNLPPAASLATDYITVWDSIAQTFFNIPVSSVAPRTLLNTLTASNSATLTDTQSLTGAFNDYEIVFENIVPATASVGFQMQVISGGAPITTTTYLNSAGGATTFVDLTQAINMVATAQHGYSGSVKMYGRPNATNAVKYFRGIASYFTGGPGVAAATVAGVWNSFAVITGLQFQLTTGNMVSGTIKIYGYV